MMLLHLPKQILIVIVVLVASVLWLLSGIFSSDPSIENKQEELMLVGVVPSNAALHVKHLHMYGISEALRRVDLKAEVEGTITELIGKEGFPIEAGEKILKIDVRDKKTALAQAEALLKQRELEHRAAVALHKKGHISNIKLASHLANFNAAQRDVTRAKQDIAHTVLCSPFSGILEKTYVEVGDLVGPNSSNALLATVIEMNPFFIVGQISERDITHVKKDVNVEARLLNDKRVRGKVRYVAHVADAATRTFRVEVEIDNTEKLLAEGMSAEVFIPTKAIPAHFIQSSALSLSDEGTVGIKVVNEKDIVEFYPIEIIDETDKGVWISGIPDTATVIVQGHGFVKAGNQVKTKRLDAAL